MKVQVKVFLAIVVLGLLINFGVYFFKKRQKENDFFATSDSVKTQGTIRVGVDSWVGYVPLCGSVLRNRLKNAGQKIECVDDKANYAKRMEMLKAGEIEFAVATVDTYILNGESVDYPGSIIMVIDESQGGDALVARKSSFSTIEEMKTKDKLKIALTPNSPSEHLMKSISSHFDVIHLRKNSKWKIETEGSEQAREKLESGDVDAAVLWEPDVTKILSKSDYVKVLGTENTKKLIVDILVVNREFAKNNPEKVTLVLENYFKSLKEYKDDQNLFLEEIEKSADVSSKQAEALMKSVKWYNLVENAQEWFGVKVGGVKGKEGLVNTIESTLDILLDHKNFSSNPLPEKDPYRLQYRTFIENLLSSSTQFGAVPQGQGSTIRDIDFSVLSEEGWAKLVEIGTLKVRPISFQSGTSVLSPDVKTEIKGAVDALEHYPNFRILIKGHTGLRGDSQANKELSLHRAEAVMKYLVKNYGLDADRVKAVGYGSERPLTKEVDESDRAFEYRLPRVEIALVSEAI